jgi:hypothetical protein
MVRENPFDFFDEIYCISVKTRLAKRRRAIKQFEELGILNRVEFLDAILREPYWDGCRESHKECVRRAKKNGANNVFIFEEDVFFIHKDLNILEKALNELQRKDWNNFLLGGVVTEVKAKVSENLCLVDAYLTHAHALNKQMFDDVLAFEGSPYYKDNGKKVFSRGNIDLFLEENTLKYMIKPVMAVQPDKGTKILSSYYNKVFL